MSLLQLVVLAVIQGLTEFLPISSSAHLILPSALLGWPDQGLAFDVAVHVGTLLAVVVYFRRDLQQILTAWGRHCFHGEASNDSRLVWYIGFATLPAGLAGLIFADFIETHLRSVAVLGIATIVFGVVLGVADKFSVKTIALEKITFRHAMLIGLAQAVALIPGTSRSGITMTAALALGYDRVSASRFSFLLSIPIIVLSGGYESLKLTQATAVPWGEIALATALSAAMAYLCIHLFLQWINRLGMMPFVWYRLVLGTALLALVVAGMA